MLLLGWGDRGGAPTVSPGIVPGWKRWVAVGESVTRPGGQRGTGVSGRGSLGDGGRGGGGGGERGEGHVSPGTTARFCLSWERR